MKLVKFQNSKSGIKATPFVITKEVNVLERTIKHIKTLWDNVKIQDVIFGENWIDIYVIDAPYDIVSISNICDLDDIK